MRTLIDIPDDLVIQLDELARFRGQSRAEVVRRALRDHLQQIPVPDLAESFGSWTDQVSDGVEYQRRIRDEWA